MFASPSSKSFPARSVEEGASLQSALLLTVAVTGFAGASLLGTSYSNVIARPALSDAPTVREATSPTPASPQLGSKTAAGLASALADAARVTRELAEVTDALDATWRKLADIRREKPYEFALIQWEDSEVHRLESFDEQTKGATAYARVMLDAETSFADRLKAQRTYWQLTDDVSNQSLLRQTKGWAHDEMHLRYEFARKLESSAAFRKKFADAGVDVDAILEQNPHGQLWAARRAAVNFNGKRQRVDQLPKISPEFDEYRQLMAAFDQKLGKEVDDDLAKAGLARAKERTMSKSLSTEVGRQEAALRTLVGRYDELRKVREHNEVLEAFAGVVRGYDSATQDAIYRKVMLPRFEQEFAKALGVSSEQAFIFHGPPGTGKTFLAKRLAELLTVEDNVRFVQGAEMNAGLVGKAEEAMRALFDEAIKKGKPDAPYVIIFDELDGVIPNDPLSGGNQARRSAFLSGLDRALKENPNIFIFGATNNLQTLDIALRRPGRFGDEIFIGAPARQGRFDVLSKLFDELAHELDIDALADYLEGLTFADIEAVLAAAKQTALESSAEARSLRPVVMDDVITARKAYVPTMLRQNDFQVKPVSWDQIAGVDDVIERLREDVVLPLTQPELFEDLGGVARPKSVLLHGPPGTGKTLIAAALAGEADINIITALASNLRRPGAVAELFGRARNAKPAIIFIDELEAVAKKRGYGGVDEVVNQLLTEMDGLGDGADDIIVIGTTNFKDSIDDAILRPGRLESHYYVGLPDEAGRRAVLDVHSKGLSFAEGKKTAPDFDELARRTDGYTPADLKALTERALLEAAKRGAKSINQEDFERALRRVGPSLTPEQIAQYGAPVRSKRKVPVGFAAPNRD